MAEVRKHEPDDGDGLGKLVREALGERIRPTQPGQVRPAATKGEEQPESGTGPSEPTAATLPTWPGDGPAFTF